MRLVKSIVSLNNELVGFEVKAKEREINPQSPTNGVIQTIMSLNDILQLQPRSSQFSVRDGRLICKSNFKVNLLPMSIIDNNNNITDINNEIKLVSRILVDGKIKGFRVQMPNGSQTPYKYRDVLIMANWFKPLNFTVRTKDGKNYIVGLKGQRIEDLPEEEMRSNKQTGKRARTSSKSVAKKEIKNQQVIKSASLLDLLELVNNCNGYVINLPNKKYNTTTKSEYKTGNEFTYLNKGEYGRAEIDYGEEKLNATVTLRKPGLVRLEGIPQDIYAFTWSAKSIFTNGINNMPVIGVGVTADVAEKIKSVYGEELIAKTIPDDKLFKMLTMRDDLEFFEINTDKVDIMSKEMASELAGTDNSIIINKVSKLALVKVGISLAKEFKKNVENEIGIDRVLNVNKSQAKLFGLYNSMDNNTLKRLKELGINPFTGEFTKKDKKSVDEIAESEEKPTVIKEENIRALKFEMAGSSSKPKIAEIEDVINGTRKLKKVTPDVINIYNTLKQLTSSNDEQAYVNVIKYLEDSNKVLKDIKKFLWLYKMSVLTTNKGVFVTNGNWAEKSSTSKKYRVFQNTSDGNVQLYVANVNVQ